MTSWRDSITVHPLADSFPEMSDGELQELAEDIKKNGQREPAMFVETDSGRTLIDGRHRLEACAMVGVEPWTTTVTLKDDAEVRAFIISQNVHRRHLTPAQRRERLEAAIIANPEKSDREIAREAKLPDHKKVGRTRKKLESTGTVAPVAKRTGKDNRARAVPRAKPKPAPASPLTRAGTSITADIGAAINGFAVGTPEVSADARKAQYAALEADMPAPPVEQPADVEQVAHTLTIPLHAEPVDIARQIIDAFGGERAASIAGEILRATAPPEKVEPAPKRGRPPGSKNKPKAAGRLS
jgi:ParB-like chromosome segregation protein Spo0J